MFKRPFSFNGRIRRLEYGLSLIALVFACFVVGMLSEVIEPEGESILTWALCIPLFWFLIAQGTKRCHDRGVRGTWQLMPYYIWMLLFAESDPGENQYGPNPKGEELIDDWDPTKRASLDDWDVDTQSEQSTPKK